MDFVSPNKRHPGTFLIVATTVSDGLCEKVAMSATRAAPATVEGKEHANDSLEEFGLTEERIRSDLDFVIRDFDVG